MEDFAVHVVLIRTTKVASLRAFPPPLVAVKTIRREGSNCLGLALLYDSCLICIFFFFGSIKMNFDRPKYVASYASAFINLSYRGNSDYLIKKTGFLDCGVNYYCYYNSITYFFFRFFHQVSLYFIKIYEVLLILKKCTSYPYF